MDTTSHRNVYESQIRDCFARAAWTHKTQEKCADIIFKRHNCIKIIQIVLSALVTTGVVVTIFGEIKSVLFFSAILSAILFVINTYVKGKDLGEIAQKHSEAASEVWNIRESYLSMLTDLKANSFDNISDVMKERNRLQNQLFEIYKGAPRTISKAYDSASKALKRDEELTFREEEIDELLPIDLRRNNK